MIIFVMAETGSRAKWAFFLLSDINIRLTPEVSGLIYAHLCCKVAIL